MVSKIIRRDVFVGVAASAAALTVFTTRCVADASEVHNVIIKSLVFMPESISVKTGDTINWTNEDIAPHTATAVEGGWTTGEIAMGETKSILVTEGMETSYYCVFHPHMNGTIKLT
ncbi:plastocyanin/azurin family copper-binding protein [Sneathiella aquimaris]|uniref:plastocyanin/azurin family copper-binding protein n=1 Tax=Sneathiella aquimaris TaxID=2599305 RepID=UPI00146E961A|nr:plastocyanin/azurin family copper-binding protein [Sneathiella aquimaris]